MRDRGADYVIGAKNFSEQYILAELMAARLEAEGARVRRKEGLGSAVIFRALAGGEIDVYVDYSGTLWTNVLERRDMPPRAALLEELTRFMRERYGVIVLGSLGFENAYALAMRSDRAAALGVRTISELAPQTPRLTLGSDLEFLSRPEWAALRDAYRLAFREERSFNPTFMYRALQDGQVDVISAFSSDGRIAADKLVVLDRRQARDPVLRRRDPARAEARQRRGAAPRADAARRRDLRRDDARRPTSCSTATPTRPPSRMRFGSSPRICGSNRRKPEETDACFTRGRISIT